MQSQDILFIVLAVCIVFITVPLSMVLWRVYKMMDHVDMLLAYVDHLRRLALKFEEMPMRFIEGMIESFMGKKK